MKKKAKERKLKTKKPKPKKIIDFWSRRPSIPKNCIFSDKSDRSTLILCVFPTGEKYFKLSGLIASFWKKVDGRTSLGQLASATLGSTFAEIKAGDKALLEKMIRQLIDKNVLKLP
jgi:hypothetical protein